MPERLTHRWRGTVGLLLAGCLGAAGPVLAQGGVVVQGRLYHSLTTEPVAGATVVLEELRRETTSAADGSFTFESVPLGSYHLIVRAPGFMEKREAIAVGADAVARDVAVDPELHYTEVVSVSPEPRNQFESYQPTTVLAGQDLAKQLAGSLGAAIETQPGMAARSFGPGPSRPVVRGLDGDRVLILENGQRTGDLSSQSGDHGVNLNPAAATRLEIVRGPASLLYGANAIGGLVNVISDAIPRQPVDGATGSFTFDLASSAGEVGGAGDVLWGDQQFAVRAGGSGRRSGDVGTPEGEIANSQSRGGFGNIGAAWTGSRGFLGGSYAYDDTKYGIPFVEGGNIELTPRRHSVNLRGEARQLEGAISSLRASFGFRRYRHEELEGDEVGTRFRNRSAEVEVVANHRPYGRLKGTLGAWAMTRAFEAEGEEALAPPVDQRGVAAFLYEEIGWPHVTFQFGGRVERASFEPEGGLRDRDFTNFSGSVGLLVRPTEATSIAFSLARASRNPALEELYFNGAHPGNFAFEIGNPDLDSEHALGFDVSFRWQHTRSSGEFTYFLNDISDYIFREPTGAIEDDFPVVSFIAADSRLQGIESHADIGLTDWLVAEVGLDYVRGERRDTRDPLPRIPPLRVRAGLRYQQSAMQFGGEVVSAAEQDRVFDLETPTGGYTLLKLFAVYSFVSGHAVNTITARLDNATNELYRNHLSFIKDFVPEMGRNFKLIYSVKF